MSGLVIYGVQAPGSVRFAWWEEEAGGRSSSICNTSQRAGSFLPLPSTDWEGLKKSLSRDFCLGRGEKHCLLQAKPSLPPEQRQTAPAAMETPLEESFAAATILEKSSHSSMKAQQGDHLLHHHGHSQATLCPCLATPERAGTYWDKPGQTEPGWRHGVRRSPGWSIPVSASAQTLPSAKHRAPASPRGQSDRNLPARGFLSSG